MTLIKKDYLSTKKALEKEFSGHIKQLLNHYNVTVVHKKLKVKDLQEALAHNMACLATWFIEDREKNEKTTKKIKKT